METGHLIEADETARHHHDVRGDGPLHQVRITGTVIAQVPARPERDGRGRGVEQFDPVVRVELRCEIRVGDHLVQQETRRGNFIGPAGRAAQESARAPTRGIVPASATLRAQCGIQEHQRVAGAIGLRWPAPAVAEIEVHNVRAAGGGAQHQLFARVVQAPAVGADHGHAAIQTVVGAEAGDIGRPHQNQVASRRQSRARQEGVVDALGEFHPGQVESDARAGVVQFHVFVATGGRIEHDLGDAQVVEQVRLVERSADGELLRQRPLAVAPRGVGVQDTRAIAAAHSQQVCRQGDVRVEGRDRAAVPHRFDFVFTGFAVVGEGNGRVRDFTHTPADRGEGIRTIVVRGAEGEAVDRVTALSGVGVRGPGRLGVVHGDGVEREGRVGGAVTEVVLHHLGRAAEVVARARLVLPLVEVIVARLAQVHDGGVVHHRVVIPHGAVGIDNRGSIRAARHPPVFVDEFEGFVGVEEEIADFAHAIPELNADRRKGAGTGEIVQHPALERFIASLLTGAVHVVRPGQIQIPRQDHPPSAHRVLVIKIIFAVGDVVLMDAL